MGDSEADDDDLLDLIAPQKRERNSSSSSSDDDDFDALQREWDSLKKLQRNLDGMTELDRERALSEHAERKQKVAEKLEIKRRLRAAAKPAAKKKPLAAESQDSSQDSDADDYVSRVKKSWQTADDDNNTAATLPTLLDLNQARLTREHLHKWAYAPFFAETAVGCFLRLSLGAQNGTAPVYRVCQVIDVVDYHRTYKLNGQPVKTALKLRHGKAEKVFLMDMVSNRDFTEPEFDRWVKTLTQESQRFPSHTELAKAASRIKKAADHVFSHTDIDYMVDLKQRTFALPKNLAMEKIQLVAQKEHAQQHHDLKTATKLTRQLEAIERKIQDPDGTGLGETQQDVWAQLNERNRRMNLEEGGQAELLARQARLDRMMMGKAANNDPFARIKSNHHVIKAENSPDKNTVATVVDSLLDEKQQDGRRDAFDEALADFDVEV